MYKDLSLSEMLLYSKSMCSDFLAGKMSGDHLLFTGVIVVSISAVYAGVVDTDQKLIAGFIVTVLLPENLRTHLQLSV
jgi:hypothetical protein